MSNTTLTIEVFEEAHMTAARDAEFRDFLKRAFPEGATAFAQTRYWHGSAPVYSVVARQDGQLLAHAGAIVRDIRVGSQIVRIYGIQNMGVLPAARGTGAGLRVLETVAREAGQRDISFGVLFCVPELERYYGRDGWLLRQGDVRMDFGGQTSIAIPGKNVCMVKCLTAQPFPDGGIHLQGADW